MIEEIKGKKKRFRILTNKEPKLKDDITKFVELKFELCNEVI